MGARLTRDGGPTHQVCVGEVQGGVEQEVGLDDAPGSLADVVEQTGALERHSALEAVLRRGQRSWPMNTRLSIRPYLHLIHTVNLLLKRTVVFWFFCFILFFC